MKKIISNFKKWLDDTNRQWHEQQRKETLAIVQAQMVQQQQYLANISKRFLLFFRPLLGGITFFDTVSMRCEALDAHNNVCRLWLQIPLRLGVKDKIPNDKTLAQLVGNLLVAECEQQRNYLGNSAYNLQVICCTPADMAKHNKMVADSECCFMNYKVAIRQVNSFKADLEVECILDTGLMESFYL